MTRRLRPRPAVPAAVLAVLLVRNLFCGGCAERFYKVACLRRSGVQRGRSWRICMGKCVVNREGRARAVRDVWGASANERGSRNPFPGCRCEVWGG